MFILVEKLKVTLIILINRINLNLNTHNNNAVINRVELKY